MNQPETAVAPGLNADDVLGDEDDEEMSPEQQEQLIAQAQARLRQRLVEKYQVPADALDQWKQQWGRIAAFPLYDDIFVIRALNRREWRSITKPEANGNPVSDEDLEERIAVQATLFPQLDPSKLRTSSYAGLATTLARNINMISGFVPGALPIVL